MYDRTTRDCPGYTRILSISGSMGLHTRILSISGSMGLHVWWDYWRLSWVSREHPMPGWTTGDCPGYLENIPCLVGLLVTVLGIPRTSHAWWDYWWLSLVSQEHPMPGGTTGDCPWYLENIPCLVGLQSTILGILGYLVSRDPWDSMPGGTPYLFK